MEEIKMSISVKKYTSHKEDLENIFRSFINAKDDKSFFFGIYDYVGYIVGEKKFNHFVNSLEREKEKKRVELDKFNKLFRRDLLFAEKKVLKIIKQNKKIREQFEHYIKRLNFITRVEKIDRSPGDQELRGKTLVEILDLLHEQGFGDSVKKFIITDKKNDTPYYYFSRYYADFILEKENNIKAREISLWGGWGKLREIYESLYIIGGNPPKKYELCGNFKVYGALDEIAQGQKQNYLKKGKYRRIVSRIYNHLLIMINEMEEKKDAKEIEKIEIPEGIKWENIEIRFSSPYDVEIFVKGIREFKTDYRKMGFANKRSKDKNPDRQWEFLRKLSIWDDKMTLPEIKNYSGNARDGRIRENETMKTQKKLLSKHLQILFGIEDDPFYKYQDQGCYKPRFKVSPEPDLRGNGNLYGEISEKNPYADSAEFMNDQMRPH